jgi:hypothetical protein
MNSFEELMMELLMRIIPDPLILAIIFLATFTLGIVASRAPASVASMSAMLMITTLTTAIGGLFNIFNMILFAVTAFALISALLNISKEAGARP